MSKAESHCPTVLIVEDFDDVRSMVKMFLERNGYCVVEAKNGYEAIKVAEQEEPNVILMDLQMPDLDGFSAARHIRSKSKSSNVPIVFTTAHGNLGIDLYLNIDTLGDGRIEYLAKPFNLQQLKELLDHLLVPA